MRPVKKIDLFILKSFFQLFIGTFFICLFIFMMQFLWRFVDDLVGKGLDINIMAQFFFYSALSLVPLSLPLAVLLASLITFGNFGERYELLAMKAAGIPLTRIMRPLIVFCFLISGISFYFQNIIAPQAQVKLYTLLISMRQKSPELDIPEGSFYGEIEGFNIYINKKNRDTGMMYGMIIYDLSQGFSRTNIIVADSGHLEMSPTKKFLLLKLYSGEQFENLKEQSASTKNVPYRRESFSEKQVIIDFDAAFSMVDGGFLNNQSVSKNIFQLQSSIDSMRVRGDSIGHAYYVQAKRYDYKTPILKKEPITKGPNAGKEKPVAEKDTTLLGAINTDSIYLASTLSTKKTLIASTYSSISSMQNNWKFKSISVNETDKQIRRHSTEWHKKITTSLACLIFFFIGAPLGGIIRKGGIGMPVVVSVLIFIVYYIIDNTGYKMARDGNTAVFAGMWISSAILAPTGLFLTYKSNKDAVVFNLGAVTNLLKVILGIRLNRHIAVKEVVIEDPDYTAIDQQLTALSTNCMLYHKKHKLRSAPNYIRTWKQSERDSAVEQIDEQLEAIVEQLSQSRNAAIIAATNELPILSTAAHKSPLKGTTLNLIAALLLPVGALLFLRIWMFRIRLKNDLQQVIATSKKIQLLIENKNFY
ncbi:MAG: LptF/LptG family permease [Bacteroidaceae bacterium]